MRVPDKEQFSTLLGEITKADRLESKKRAPTIRNLYLDGCRYLKSEKKAKDERSDMEPKEKQDYIDKSTAISGNVLGKLLTAEYGSFIFKDKKSIAVARRILDLIEKDLNGKEEASEEEG